MISARVKSLLRATAFGVCAIALGCASAAQPDPELRTTVAAEAAPCPVPVADPMGEQWRAVRATGFTFCVPASWRPQGRPASAATDARRWRGGSGQITWGTGSPPRRTGTAIVAVPADQPLPAIRGNIQRFSETIGGQTAELHSNEIEGRHYTGATWSQPAVYLQGEGNDPATARLQLIAYRTVRFGER